MSNFGNVTHIDAVKLQKKITIRYTIYNKIMINISKTLTGMFLRAVYCTIVDSIQKIITAVTIMCSHDELSSNELSWLFANISRSIQRLSGLSDA